MGRQEFKLPVYYQWSGRPGLDVCTSRFESVSQVLGPPGYRGVVHRLQRRLRGLRRVMVKAKETETVPEDDLLA